MDQDLLAQLESIRDWQGILEELEKELASGQNSNVEKAACHFRAGRILKTKFLSSVKALKHFQDAYKLNPQLTESLEAAREIYWELGKLNMVQKLLELELKTERSPQATSDLLTELGHVLTDNGDYDKATATYARALNANSENRNARAALEDVQCESGSWKAHVQEVLRNAERESGADKALTLLRAARIAKRFAPADVEALLEQAYASDPLSAEISTLYEGMLSEAERLAELEKIQTKIIESSAPRTERAKTALAFGGRWIGKHQQPETGLRLLEAAVKLDPNNEGAFQYLRDAYGKKAGDWERVLTLAEEAATNSEAENEGATFLLAQAATIAWKQLGNLIRARTAFERLSAVAPSHPQLLAFEGQIGEKLSPPNFSSPTAPPPAAAGRSDSITVIGQVIAIPPAPSIPPAPAAPAPVRAQEPIPPAPVAAEKATAVAPPPASGEGTSIAALMAQAEKQEGAKRYNEYVKTLIQLAAVVEEPSEKVAYYTKAADLYVSKFANQAEAVKAYEQVLAIEPDNQTAVDYLRQMYEKRRDWEKLLGLERREADSMLGSARAAKFLEIAKLATERIKKPEVCIELWNEVLETDGSNSEALNALGQLYERSKEFDKLAAILEKQAEHTDDNAQRVQILTKLGTIYGDRLNNDEGAVNAWRALLAIDPNDRKAQEALKKKYLAIGDWDELEVFYAESGKWDEFIRVLEQQEVKETRSDAKIRLLFKIANLWADKKQKLDRAAKAYEKVLELESSNLQAAEALIPIYSASGNSKALAGAIEVKLANQEASDDKVALLREVAALYETKVKDSERAFQRYLTAFTLAPSDSRSVTDLERAAGLTKGWKLVIDAYSKAIDDSVEPDTTVRLRLRSGRILVEELSQVDEALACYRAVYEADSENGEALSALERLYRQTSRFPDLLGIYERKRDLADSPTERRAIQYEIARLFESEAKDIEKAIETYNAILDDAPSEAPALEALDRLYGSLGRYEPYADVLRRRIELDVAESELIDLKFRLGQTLEKHLGDPRAALDNYREILFLAPGHDKAREALENLLNHKELRADAAGILESIYEERGDWSKLASTLSILTEGESDPKRKVQLERKIARISSEHLGDASGAFKALASALREEPELVETRTEIERTAETSGKWKELVALYRETAESLSDASLARLYWMRSGHIHESRLEDIDSAASCYTKVLSLDASDEGALTALETLYERTERHEDLIGVAERRVELSHDVAVQEDLYARIASIYDTKLGRAADAVTSYRKILDLDPASSRALLALDQLLTRQCAWPDLAQNLEAQLALADAQAEQIRLMLRLANLQETELEQIEQAIEGYRSVLERDLQNTEALSALEGLGARSEYELTIADLLEPHYRQTGDVAKLVQATEVQVKHAEDGARRVELLHRIAGLHEDSASDSNAAFSTLARALSEDPSNETTQGNIDRIARATGRYKDLADVYERLGKSAGEAHEDARDVELASSLYGMSAKLHEEELGSIDTAIDHYRKVLVIAPRSVSAITSLERLFRGTERYAELSQTLQTKGEILDEPQEKKDAFYQAASIEEDVLEKPEAAIAVYKKVLEFDADDVRALDALIRRYLGLSRWNELLEVYARKADLVANPDEKKRILYQVGAVHERELGQVPEAIATYNQVLEIDPDDLSALSRLDVLYEQAANWPELLNVLGREAEMTSDTQEAISFHYRIAELYEKRLEDAPRAIELYRELLQQQPDHVPTLQALEGLKSSKDAVAAASVLEPIYESSGDWSRLIEVHEVQVAHAEDAFARVDLLHRIARLHEEALENPNAALDTYARALPVDSANEQTLAQLERLSSLTNRWRDVAQLYDIELAKIKEQPERYVELGLRVAEIYEERLENNAGAIERFKLVIEADPVNTVALRSLDRLYSNTEQWTDLAPVLAREAETAESGTEALEFRYRLGAVQQTQLKNIDGAIAAYRDVLEANQAHGPALQAVEHLFSAGTKQVEIGAILEPIYAAGSEWEKLAVVHEARLSHTEVSEERLQHYYTIASLYEDKLMDPVRTLNVFLRALLEAPLDERSHEEVQRLAPSIDGGFEAAANTFADILTQHEDIAVQKSVGLKLARTFEDELGDIQKAEETFAYVLGRDPADADALSNLDRIYTTLQSWPELAGILEMRVKVPAETTEHVELYARLGEVYETHLADLPNATLSYRKIFNELDRTHEGAIQALSRIYGAQNAHRELNEVFERELENVRGTSSESDIHAKIAHLAATHLGEPERAIDTWKLVLDQRGEDAEALGGLANLYEQRSAWPDLVDVLDRQCDAAASDDDRVNILTRKARTFTDKMQRDDLAASDWNRVLDVDFANLAALRAVAAIRRRQGDAGELVAALHMTVDRANAMLDEEELREIYRELAKTYADPMGQPYDSAEAWRKLLLQGPDFEAFDSLEAIYRNDEKWEEVVDIKMQRAAALEGSDDQVEEYRAAAALWVSPIEKPDGATVAWQKVLELSPLHDEGYSELEKLHIAGKRWEPLLELYLGRLDSRENIAEKTELLRKIAKVFEEKLEDKSQAFDALMQALELDIFDRETAKYLEQMAHETRRWPELLNTVNAWLKAEKDPKRKIRLCLHLAKWYGDDLNRPDYAQPMYAQIVQLEPNNVGAIRQMAQLYRKSGNYQKYGEALTKALDVAIQDVDQKEILTELGELLEGQMGQQEQALEYFKRALKVDGNFLPALDNLERIYTARGNNRELVDVLSRKVPALKAPEDIVQTRLRVASIYESQLNEKQKAGTAYREVLEVESSNLQALRGLARVYSDLEQWPDLVRTLEAELTVVETERERADALMHLAHLQEEKFLKSEIAAGYLEQALEIDPNSEDAYFALERNYRKLRQWPELLSCYDRHISTTLDRATKVDLYGHIAQVQADELDDSDKAIDAYRNIVDIDDANVPALEALAKLYEKAGDAQGSVDYMTRVAELTSDSKQRVEAFYRIGRALDEKLGDRVSAQDKYEVALDLDPSHLPTLGALKQIALDNADYDKAARYIDQEQSYTTAPRQRAKLLVELGRLREEMLQDHDSAVLAWEAAVEADPENEEAALPLADECIATEQWQRAEPLLELLTRKAGKRDRSEQHELNRKLGKVAASLGKDDRAFKAYSAAHQLDLTNQETVRGLSDVSFRLKDWGTSLTNFQKVLTGLEESDTEARADVYYHLGAIKKEQGQPKQAITNFEKALSVHQTHKPTLEALVAIYTELKDWKQVVAYKRQILDDLVDGEERFALLGEIADIWSENDKNPARAIEALEEARDIKPTHLPLLNRLLALYPLAEQWARMIDTIQAIADVEKDPIRKSKFLFTIAQLYRDKENDLDRAVELFNEALDLNPQYLEAFERINKILTNQKDWKGLERAFRKMLRRLSSAGIQNPDLEWNLWHNLGLIYRDRMQDPSSAIEAFKMATRYKPDEAVERQILAELYEVTDQVEAAIGEHWIVLQRDPMKVEPYRALYRLALKVHDYDRAWTLCAALSFLGKADEDERGFFEQYRPKGMVQVRSRLDNEQWVKNLFHKEESIFIGKIFEMVTPAAVVAKTQALARAKQLPTLDPRFKQDPATSTVTFAKTFGWAAQVLGVQQPDLYVRNDVPGALIPVPSSPPASVAGQTVLTGFTPQELTFIVGKHLSGYRGEHYLKNLFPTLAELKVVMFAGIKIIMSDFNVPPDMAQAVNGLAVELAKTMRPIERDSLRIVVQKFVDDGARADLKRWMQVVEVTAARAGLLLCGDLDIAKKIIAAEPQLPGELSPSEKMKELLIFSVSEQYLALRKALGIAVGSSG
jgi:golgin subfamily B member 1